LGKMTSMAVVGHNMNSTFTDRTTSTIYAPVVINTTSVSMHIHRTKNKHMVMGVHTSNKKK
jgi:hypothetical protein